MIIHEASHLDEFAADLLLMASVPERVLEIEFVEQALESREYDLVSQHIWPSSAVIGMGATIAGAQARIMFDEHLPDGGRTHPSALSMTCQTLYGDLPHSVKWLIREVNAIDQYGGAHQQHLGNIIKNLHLVRYAIGVPGSSKVVAEYLSSAWKRGIIHAALTAVIYCLESRIDLIGDPEEKSAAAQRSFERYCASTPNQGRDRFATAKAKLIEFYEDQSKVFADAILHDKKKPIVDQRGKAIPQLLVLSRLLFAIEQCWGEYYAAVVGLHLWEVELQKQLYFEESRRVLKPVLEERTEFVSSSIGTIRCAYLKLESFKRQLWLIELAPHPGNFAVDDACKYLVNQMNDGFGLILVNNEGLGTKALFKTKNVPDGWWDSLRKEILGREPECWYKQDVRGGVTPYLLNGNAAHRYMPRSALDLESLSALVRAM